MSQTTWEKIEPESQHITLSTKKINKRITPTLGTKITKIDKAPTSQNKHAIEKK